MSEPQQAVEEKRAEDVKPLELPGESTESAAPVVEGEKKAEDVTALPLPQTSTTGAETQAEEPKKEAETAVEKPVEKKAAEPVTSGVLGYKAPGLMK